MEVVAPGPAILVVDRDPEMAVDRVIAARRDHGERRHHPRRDAPIIVAVLGIASSADEEPSRLLDHLEIWLHVGEIVLIAPGALEQRVGTEVAAVEKRDVTRIDAALHGLQPIAFLQPLGDEDWSAGTDVNSHSGSGGCFSAGPRQAHSSGPRFTSGYDLSLIFLQNPLSTGSDGTSTHWPVTSYFQP